MNHFLAYGAGVGSTALIFDNLKDIRSGEIEVVYSDHESDLPESRDYVKQIQQDIDIDVTVLKPGNLYDYCWQKQILPSIHWRWCTDKFKIRPMRKYVDGDIPIIGITLDERRRVGDFAFQGKSEFPFVQQRVTRNQAEQMITVDKPCKSGCFFCPFQKKEQWRKLFVEHNDLFIKAMKLEENAQKRNPKIWLYEGGLNKLHREFKFQKVLLEWCQPPN